MTFNIQDLNKVDDNNQQNWPEGTQKVNEVNNAGRADEGMLARWYADENGTKITAGTATAYTVSSDTAPTAYADGLTIVAEIHVENTGAATLNVNSLGVANIIKNGGESLAAGDLPAGHLAYFIYRGTDFNLIATKIGSAGTKNTGTAIGDVVELEDVSGSAGLPAVDGSQLTGIAGSITKKKIWFFDTGTFDKSQIPAGVANVLVKGRGVGGGGAGSEQTTVGNESSVGSGAGEGGYFEKLIAVSALLALTPVTIGTPGLGGDGVSGGNGTSSSFGTHCSAASGRGGITSAPQSGYGGREGGRGGDASGGDLNIRGANGHASYHDEAGNRKGGGAGGGQGGGQGTGADANAPWPNSGGGGAGSASSGATGPQRRGSDGAKGWISVEWDELA